MAPNTSGTLSTTTAASSSSTSSPSLPSIASSITVKLDQENYLLWRAQFVPALHAHDLMGFVDGSIKEPAKLIAAPGGDDNTAKVPNPLYATWFRLDQQVLSAILASLTPGLLGHVLFMATAEEAWKALQEMFASRSRARIVQLRVQLATTQKGDMSMAEYYHRMKNLADTMSSIGQPLSSAEIVSYMLAGLGDDYDNLITSLTSRTEDVSIGELYAHLMSYEARHPTRDQIFQHSANNAMRGGGRGSFGRGGGGRGGRGSGGGRGGGNCGNNTNNGGGRRDGGNGGTNYGGNGGGRGDSGGRGNGNGGRPKSTCQICGKYGHDALRCYSRFDHSYQPETKMAGHVSSGSDSYGVDSNWYLDTGATDHLTNDVDKLNMREAYKGNDHVQVANGSSHEGSAGGR